MSFLGMVSWTPAPVYEPGVAMAPEGHSKDKATPDPPSPPPSTSSSTTLALDDQFQGLEKVETAALRGRSDLEKLETNASALYNSIPLWRKGIVVFVTSWTTLAACFSSTSLLSAAPEIAADLNTSTEIVNLSTGGLLIAMGLSSFIWSPLTAIFGRRLTYNVCLAVLCGFTIGAAVAPNMPIFVTMRVLSGLQGCFFHVAGQTIIAEYFPPTQRGTATGFFLAGTVLGPPTGPLVAGIMVTYASWRSILWLQVAMVGVSFILALFFIPSSLTDAGVGKLNLKGWDAVKQFSPLPVFSVMGYPNIIFTHLSCGLLSWTQYSILSAPRHILSSRFGLTSPLTTGLFYIAPASGFLLGTVVGGRYSDMTVRKWIDRRGERLPQDRLNSGMLAFFFLIPVASLIYGWGLQCDSCSTGKGGLALPIVTTFATAAGLLGAFASLNTYCAEAIPKKRREVIAGKYLIQYIFSASSCAGSVPLMEAIGIGPSTTIGVIFVLIAGTLTLLSAKYGLSMQRWSEETSTKRSQKPARKIVPHQALDYMLPFKPQEPNKTAERIAKPSQKPKRKMIPHQALDYMVPFKPQAPNSTVIQQL